MSRRRRRDINNLESLDYSYSICMDGDKGFDQFYWEMYLPYAEKRFGKAAYIRTYLEARDIYKRNGGIIFVKKGNDPVAGILFKVVGKKLWAQCFGVYKGDQQLVKDLAGQATLFYLLLWAKINGFESLDYGACGPFLKEGLFIHKKEWGMDVVERDNQSVCALKLNFLCQGSLSFLQHNPFILLDEGVMKGVTFIDHSPTEAELQKIFSDYFLSKLDSIMVISYHNSPRTAFDNKTETSTFSETHSPSFMSNSLRTCCLALKNCGFDVDVFELRSSKGLKIIETRIKHD
jgi:hypothetical protein